MTTVAKWSRLRTDGRRAMSPCLVPLKTRSVGRRCTLNLSKLKRPSDGMVVRRRGCQLRGAENIESVEARRPYVGVVWKFGEYDASSVVVPVT
ncbi:hypothetical protein TNCV_2336291 [Trichonephila clavipes]|uniref:Uncharacterized protein n=1 Tax=Trichonephila clavipes TaxID=2585209 RepID=A0A8X6SL86_TRICX|nr:hypothetical protein TNCV_2336291 [Trichonephila clavipes]